MRDLQDLPLDLPSLLSGYRENRFTPEEVMDSVLERASRKEFGAVWITLLNRASLAPYLESLKRESPDSKPLYGIPFAIKDNIDLAGIPTTAGCPEYAFMPQKSAFVVELLIAAGAIPVGKTNLDQFAAGLVGARSPYGVPPNSYDPEMVPGGSSSGSAAAVALGLVTFALGTDTAGSGRVPAAFNNLIGWKPTCGSVSTSGVVPACRSLDCVTLFTRTLEEADRIRPFMTAEDAEDPWSRKVPERHDGFRSTPVFGIPEPEQLKFFGNEAYKTLFMQAADLMVRLGFRKKVIDASPFLKSAELLYGGPWVAERYAALEDFINSKPEAFWPETRTIIEKGKLPSAVECFRAGYALKGFMKQAEPIWDEIDFLLLPTAGTCYSVEEVRRDPIALNTNLGYYTNFVNLMDLSALALPAGFTSSGFPFGITLCARPFQDGELFRIGRQWRRNEGTGTMDLAVCGAHRRGFPLNYQLLERDGRYLKTVNTAPEYSFYRLDTDPPKPGLLHTPGKGGSIEMEIWRLPRTRVGGFLDKIPSPLCLGKILLSDGTRVTGFLAEPDALDKAEDITRLGSWVKAAGKT